MNSPGAEDPQRDAWTAGLGSAGALGAAGMGTWYWNTVTDAFVSDRCCLQLLDALDTPPLTLESLLRLVHPADRSLLRGALRDATGARATTSIAFRIAGRDTAERWLQCLVARRAPLPGDVDTLLVGVLGRAGAAFPGPGAEPRPDLQEALQAAPVASAKFDRALGLVHANARFLETLRLQQFDWQDKTLFDALPEMPATWRDAIRRCLGGEELEGAAEGFERVDGSHDHVDGHIYPWYDDRNEIGGVLLITEVRATAADARFTLVIDQAPVGIAVADANGQVRYANPAWIGLVGRGRDEIVGTDVLHYLHPDDRAEPQVQPRRLPGGAGGEREVRVVLPSGEVRWIELLGRPMRDQSGAAAVIYAALDVTGRARQQRESGQMLAQLRELVLHLDDLRGHERSQTAQALQHGLYESLFGLHAELDRWARDPAAAGADTDTAGQLAQRSHAAVEQLRHVLFALTPPGIAELGLAGALERLCSEQRDRTGLPIELALPPQPVGADEPRLDALYQAGREALIDATTHDGVTRIRVQVDLQPGAIRLRVEDNGFGQREADARARGRDSGLLAASLRLRALGGTMRVLGVAGVATTVEVSVPSP